MHPLWIRSMCLFLAGLTLVVVGYFLPSFGGVETARYVAIQLEEGRLVESLEADVETLSGKSDALDEELKRLKGAAEQATREAEKMELLRQAAATEKQRETEMEELRTQRADLEARMGRVREIQAEEKVETAKGAKLRWWKKAAALACWTAAAVCFGVSWRGFYVLGTAPPTSVRG